MMPGRTQLYAYLTDYRQRLEQVWREETASPNLRPIAGKPLSTGQCSATSLVLFDDLQDTFGKLDVKIALGKVWYAKDQVWTIPLHVWLQLYVESFRAPLLVDLAADQSSAIHEKVICMTSAELINNHGYVYVVDNLFERQLKPQTHERAELLKRLLAEDKSTRNTNGQ